MIEEKCEKVDAGEPNTQRRDEHHDRHQIRKKK